MGAEIGSTIGMEVARALEDADLDFDNIDYNLDWGDATHPDQLKEALAAQMTADGKVSNGKNSLVITDRTLKINGKLQSTDQYNRYKSIIQDYQNDAFDRSSRTKVKFHFYGDNFEDSERIGLSVDIQD